MPRIPTTAAALASQVANAPAPEVAPVPDNTPAVIPSGVQLPACLAAMSIVTPPKSSGVPYVQIANAKAQNYTELVQAGFRENDAVLITADGPRRIDAFQLAHAETLYTTRADDGSCIQCWEADPGRSAGAAEDIQAVLLVYTPEGDVIPATASFRRTRSACMKTMADAIGRLPNPGEWFKIVGFFAPEKRTTKSGPRKGQPYVLIDARPEEITASRWAVLAQFFRDEAARPEEEKQVPPALRAHESRMTELLGCVRDA